MKLPEFIYLPTYCLPGMSYTAGMLPNDTWREGDYGPNTCVFDSSTIEALDRLVTGQILNWSDLDTIELAIRSFILHEKLYWMLPAVMVISPEKVVKGNGPAVVQDSGHIIYPKYSEPQAFIDILREAGATSYSVYSTWVYVKNEKPVGGHDFWVKNYDRLRSGDQKVVHDVFEESFRIKYFKDSYITSPRAIGAGSYLGSEEDRDYEKQLVQDRTAVFPEKVLKMLDESWAQEVIGSSIGLNIRLGPFLAITLTRAENRNDIPRALSELREEFKEHRQEFWDLFVEPLNERRSTVAIRKLRSLEKAIGSVIPASFPRKERSLNFFWDTAHLVFDIAETGGIMSAIKYAGGLLLQKDKHRAQVSTIGATKLLASELRKMDESLVHQLQRQLSKAELRNLGLF